MSTSSRTALSAAIAATLISVPAFAVKPGEESTGNNLSTPVIWAEGISKPQRTYDSNPKAALFLGQTFPCTDIPGETCYQQQDADNIWQAESWDATTDTTSYDNGIAGFGTGPLQVDEIDWGDNLEARDWNVNSIIRLEVVLWQLLGDATGNHALPMMTAWDMSYLFGQGPSEMWGTTTYKDPAPEATVYSDCARLTIQKIAELDEEVPDLDSNDWDPENAVWEGYPTFFNSAVWEAGTGPGFFSAETNISGKVIYGYGWNARKIGDGDGVYRLTFSLDGTFPSEVNGQQCGSTGSTVLNTELGNAAIRVPVEEVDAQEEGDTGGGTAMIDNINNLTYIDIKILPRSGGGGAGGGNDDSGIGKGNGKGNGGPKKR